MWSTVGSLVATIAVAFLKAYWGRQDAADKVRLELSLEMEKAYGRSLAYRVAAGDASAVPKLRDLGGTLADAPTDPPSP